MPSREATEIWNPSERNALEMCVDISRNYVPEFSSQSFKVGILVSHYI